MKLSGCVADRLRREWAFVAGAPRSTSDVRASHPKEDESHGGRVTKHFQHSHNVIQWRVEVCDFAPGLDERGDGHRDPPQHATISS
jgi:hypothetical protein